MIVTLDLRRDLPKLQRALPKLLSRMGGLCEYAQPCAIGVMVPRGKRAQLDRVPYADAFIKTLVRKGDVKVPDAGQITELQKLQNFFDSGDGDGLTGYVAKLAKKYSPASVTGTGTAETAPQAQGQSPARTAGAAGDAQPLPDKSEQSCSDKGTRQTPQSGPSTIEGAKA